MKNNLKLGSIFVLLAIITLSQAGCSKNAAATPVVLTVTNGSVSKTYSLAQIEAMPSVSGSAGTINGGGAISGQLQCKGVAMTQILSEVGGFTASDAIEVIGSDGYTVTLSYQQVTQGSFQTFDITSGDAVTASAPLTAFLEYQENGVALGTDVGPLRLGILSPQGQVTMASLWVKWVDKIGVVPAK